MSIKIYFYLLQIQKSIVFLTQILKQKIIYKKH